MSLLPPSTNDLSRGSLASVWFLGLYGLLELGTGRIHYLLPDGGAGLVSPTGPALWAAFCRHSLS